MADKYQSDQEYGVFIYHDRYDIPSKAADHKRLGESVQFFEYLICAVCRVSGDYEPEKPECGFLFPAYSQGGALVNCIDIFQDNELYPHTEFAEMLLEQSIDIDESVLYDDNINTHPSIAKHSTQLSLAVKYSVRYFYEQKAE